MPATVASPPTTARDLYEQDGVFRAAITAWDHDRRCPLELVDYLLEHDLYAQAEAARWAATEPERENFFNGTSIEDPNWLTRGPYPVRCREGWVWNNFPAMAMFAHGLPREQVKAARKPPRGRQHYHKTATDAIIHLLDAWKEPNT